MTARVISPCTIHNLPRSVGELVEVDANTLRNLIAKGRLEEYVATVAPPEKELPDRSEVLRAEIEEREARTLADFGPKLCGHQWEAMVAGETTEPIPWDKIAPDAIFTCALCGAEAFKSDLKNPNEPAKRGPGRPRKNPMS